MTIAAIDALLNEQVVQQKTPSVQYHFFDKDSILHSFKGGHADIQNKIESSDQTAYYCYSITKTFTALAVLQLAELHQISINVSVKKYLSDFPYSEAITIKQLLSHSAGIPNPIPLSWVHLAAEHDTFDRIEFFKKVFRKHPKPRFQPNEKFGYSNPGYVLLGDLVEKLSGVSYENYIKQHILEPVGLGYDELGFVISNPDVLATGYHKKSSLSYFLLDFFIDTDKFMGKTEGKWRAFRRNYVNGPAYGGLIGTSHALVKYVQELLKPDSTILSPANRLMMFAENHLNNNRPSGMCLSWFTGQLNGQRYYSHSGGGGGFYCEIRLYPASGLGSVIMFNRTGMTDERYLDKVDKFVIGANVIMKGNA